MSKSWSLRSYRKCQIVLLNQEAANGCSYNKLLNFSDTHVYVCLTNELEFCISWYGLGFSGVYVVSKTKQQN